MVSSCLAFLCGTMVATIAATIYAIHVERVQSHNLQAARSAGYNDGLIVGKMQRLQREVKP